MKRRELSNLGVPSPLLGLAIALTARAAKAERFTRQELATRVEAVLADPQGHADDAHLGELARALGELAARPDRAARGPGGALAPMAYVPRDTPAPWKQWGTMIDREAIGQLENACRLPITVAGALLPDAHIGYGLPIGGVLATDNAVIPYAVGVDIACRVRLTILDMPPSALDTHRDRLEAALQNETRFGLGASFKKHPRRHAVLDADWSVTPITKREFPKARVQLGTSGTGNHFVELGILELDHADLGVPAGNYLALLSHSGSRGPGGAVCDHYSKVAMSRHPDLPKELRYLAWLPLDSAEGQEYWAAMELMGQFAQANHEVIHEHVVRALGGVALASIENHHNFAWKEVHHGRELVVHRKGATPAQAGVLGVIPGSMATPTFVVRGKGSVESLHSSAHGAGRVMSRTKAKQHFRWNDVKRLLAERDVTLLSADLDEVPGVYKDIHQVMAEQSDLVEVVARFDPRLVKMAPPGERAED